MPRIWDEFPTIAARVRQSHEEARITHHDYAHAQRVAYVAHAIAMDEWGNHHIAMVAGLAGLCHNADHILQLWKPEEEVTEGNIADLVLHWTKDQLHNADRKKIIRIVMRHGQVNKPDDPEELIALKDGDRVVNLDVDVWLRGAQNFPNLPVVDFEHYLADPAATYHAPRSNLRNIAYCLDWVTPSSPVCMRTKLGWKKGKERAAHIQATFDILREQLTEEGMTVPS